MTNQQNIGKNLPLEIPPSRRVYAFKDLPKNVQENLLRLQNSDGDFLKVCWATTFACRELLIYLSIVFILFLADFAVFLYNFENAAFDFKWIIVFAGGASAFSLCFLYLFRGFFREKRSPIKTGIYLTPTQIVETFDGAVRYRDLKDESEFSLDKFQGGWQTSLDVKFADGDFYKYRLYYNDYSALPSKKIAEAEKWREKAGLWRNEAISAAQCGDAAYFDSWDVMQKSAAENSPVLKNYFSPRVQMGVMLVIIVALVLFDIAVFLVIS